MWHPCMAVSYNSSLTRVAKQYYTVHNLPEPEEVDTGTGPGGSPYREGSGLKNADQTHERHFV